MRRLVIAGNWKMHRLASDAAGFMRSLESEIHGTEAEVYIAPPFTALSAAVAAAGCVKIGAQTVHEAPQGAFTGEISAPMLKDLGVHFVLLGHSERRQLFAEDSALVCRKLKRALDEGLEPIVCVGELLEERKEGRTFEVLREQLMESLGDLSAAQMSRLILAYEPVWAIGTGETASPEQAQEVHAFLRQLVAERWGDVVAQGLVIQYGGSVKPANAATLLKQPDIDGLLVGGASLEATSFAQIVNSQAKVSESR